MLWLLCSNVVKLCNTSPVILPLKCTPPIHDLVIRERTTCFICHASILIRKCWQSDSGCVSVYIVVSLEACIVLYDDTSVCIISICVCEAIMNMWSLQE